MSPGSPRRIGPAGTAPAGPPEPSEGSRQRGGRRAAEWLATFVWCLIALLFFALLRHPVTMEWRGRHPGLLLGAFLPLILAVVVIWIGGRHLGWKRRKSGARAERALWKISGGSVVAVFYGAMILSEVLPVSQWFFGFAGGGVADRLRRVLAVAMAMTVVARFAGWLPWDEDLFDRFGWRGARRKGLERKKKGAG